MTKIQIKKPAIRVKFPKLRLKLNFLPKAIQNVVSNKELRKRIIFTIFIIVVIRALSTVPIPGFTKDVIETTTGDSPFSTFYTLITGGRIDSFSVIAIGIGPYINASIILQLLSSVIPKLEEISKEGERGKKIINQYTRYLTLPLALVQSTVIIMLLFSQLSNQGNADINDFVNNLTVMDKVVMIVSMTAGSMILMWFGELITERGIGNGSSVVIMIGILGSLPSLIKQDLDRMSLDFPSIQNVGDIVRSSSFLPLTTLIIGFIIMIIGIVFVTEATRKLVIQYAKRVRATGAMRSSFLPIKLNQAGVIPVIFASSLLSFPQIISSFVTGQFDSGFGYDIANKINGSFLSDFGSTGYLVTYFLLIIAFSYFYTFVVMKPDEVADNLKKSSGFIPGIRPGESTAKYIATILIKLTFVGSLFLATIALIPNLFRIAFQEENLLVLSGIGGTSILIIVGVIIDTYRQIGSYTITSSYEKYR
ncbi:MAG: Protein translocase subunit SecY [candidate division WS6 bacterium GW2011_GWA2_37_6]|uniref:Protein translocase subunit SecY n=1 Tax=candidate division WS6 bacterium GW2011_GWA2_37_6 TaxID=1619087 RepID=A0A0G0HBJ8_9BACT|nr:MAG: Protein translocase subunit SecY [candidate division WS6 bacterium GW2011_GWA2_37_6]